MENLIEEVKITEEQLDKLQSGYALFEKEILPTESMDDREEKQKAYFSNEAKLIVPLYYYYVNTILLKKNPGVDLPAFRANFFVFLDKGRRQFKAFLENHKVELDEAIASYRLKIRYDNLMATKLSTMTGGQLLEVLLEYDRQKSKTSSN